MLPYRDSRLTIAALAVFFVIAALYALFEARGVLLGPTIILTTPVSEVHEPFVMIKGQAERISSLSMNGAPIPVTKDGAFAESYVLAAGYNRIGLEAKDQYGRSTQKDIEIIYTPAGQSPQASASSTISSSSTVPVAQ